MRFYTLERPKTNVLNSVSGPVFEALNQPLRRPVEQRARSGHHLTRVNERTLWTGHSDVRAPHVPA
jgi:hypothetical protein